MDEFDSSRRRLEPATRGRTLFEVLEPRICLASIAWDGGPFGLGTSWHDPVNWDGDILPAPSDEVLIDSGTGVEFSSGSLELLTLVTTRPLFIRGGTLSVSNSAAISNQITLDGGALGGGAWVFSGPGLHATAAADNALTAAAITGDISLSMDNAFIRITGGLIVNGLVSLTGVNAAISFEGGTQILSGNADVVFAGFTGTRYISADANAVLTIDSSVCMSGQLGALVSGRFSGSGSIVNQGTIWADAAFGTITVSPSTFTNLGTLRATNFATLRMSAGAWTSSGIFSINNGTIGLGGTFDITSGFGTFSRAGGEVFIEGTILNTNFTLNLNAATGAWAFSGGQILGGTINVSAAGMLGVFPSRSGRIAGAVINGNLVWTASNTSIELNDVALNGNLDFGSFSTLTIKAGLVLNGTLTVVGAQTLVEFTGAAQFLTGAATVLLRHEEAYFWAIEPLTIDIGVTVSGYGRMFGELLNAGSVVSDTPGKTLIIGHGSFNNDGSMAVSGGARLWIGETIGGDIVFENSGTLSASGPSTLAVGPSSFSGPIAFANSGAIDISGGSTLTFGWQLVFVPIAVTNAGTINVTGSTMILGSVDATIPVAFVNSGFVQAFAGAVISVRTPATTSQLGNLRAVGGAVEIATAIDNSFSTLTLNSTSGSWMLKGGTIAGGTINLNGANLTPDSSTANALNGVTLTGTLALSQPNARLKITSGLTLNGQLTISGHDAILWFGGGVQFVQGAGQVILGGASGTQSMSADSGALVAIGSEITVSGDSGGGAGTAQLRSGLVAGGQGAFVNLGLITGSLLVNATSFSNSGIVEARDGTTLSIQGSVTNYSAGILSGGTWRVGQAAKLSFGPGPIFVNQAAIILDGTNSEYPALASLAVNIGSLVLAGGRDLALSGSLINTGTIHLGPGSDLAITNAFVQFTGTLTLSLDGSAPPTLSASTVRLGGTLQVAWIKGYIPPSGSTITFLSTLVVRSLFTEFDPDPLPRVPALIYSSTSVSISITDLPNGRG